MKFGCACEVGFGLNVILLARNRLILGVILPQSLTAIQSVKSYCSKLRENLLEKITLRITIVKFIAAIFFGSILGLVVAAFYWALNDSTDLLEALAAGALTAFLVSWSIIAFGILAPFWEQHYKDRRP